MQREQLADLAAFVAVAQERSFTRAAAKLGITQSTLSHTIRRLESRLGLRLLARTTRSVAPTDAGERLLARLRPALTDVQDALDQLSAYATNPRAACGCSCRGLPEPRCLDRNWRSLRAIIRTWFSKSLLMTGAWILLPEASMQASISSNSFRRT